MQMFDPQKYGFTSPTIPELNRKDLARKAMWWKYKNSVVWFFIVAISWIAATIVGLHVMCCLLPYLCVGKEFVPDPEFQKIKGAPSLASGRIHKSLRFLWRREAKDDALLNSKEDGEDAIENAMGLFSDDCILESPAVTISSSHDMLSYFRLQFRISKGRELEKFEIQEEYRNALWIEYRIDQLGGSGYIF
eukprot:GHVP01068306.1.p1 GENE.GHVP01068306.1~~GHVP01068306.1.p1  ORF type:complete len:191 (+),score=40.01 GHVP01068306.1:460-1032(+)